MSNRKNKAHYLLDNFVLIYFILMLSFFVFGNVEAQENEDQHTIKFPNVEIAGTQVREIYSSIVDQEYKLYINLPRNYEDKSKTFPVVYLLDAQWDFPLVSAIYGQQYYDGFLPELIIVGITWGGENMSADGLRARDFTPTNINQPGKFGNAPRFLEFIRKELIPFIESNYRVSKTDRTLMGSSFGGLFTLYALFNDTSLFNRYALTSPALGWDDGIIKKYEMDYSKQSSQLPARLYIAVGALESNLSDFEKFVKQLQNRNYSGFEMDTRVIDGIGHSGGKAEGFTRGLQFVFSNPSLLLSDSILQQYIGSYEINNNIKINIGAVNNRLVVTFPDNNKIILQAETESDFYVNGEFAKVHFNKDDLGKVTGFEVSRYDGKQIAKRIN